MTHSHPAETAKQQSKSYSLVVQADHFKSFRRKRRIFFYWNRFHITKVQCHASMHAHTHSSKADAIPLPDIYKQPFPLTVFYMLPWKHVCICDSVSTGCSTWHYCSYWLHSVDSLTQHSTSLFNTSCGTCDFTQTGTFVWNSLQQKAAGSKLCKSVRIIYLMCPFFVLLNMTLSHSLRKSRFSGHQALPKDAHRLKMAVSLFPEIGF